MPSPGETLSLLAKRGWLIKLLRNYDASRQELVRESDRSRSTVYRGIEELNEHNIAKRENGVWGLTPTGCLLYGEYRRWLDVIASLNRINESSGGIPVDQLSSDLLFRADLHISGRQSPRDAQSVFHEDIMGNRIKRISTPTISPLSESFLENTGTEGVVMVIEAGGFPPAKRFGAQLSEDHSIYEVGGEIPFVVYEGEDCEGWFCGVFIYSAIREITIRNHTRKARSWVDEYFESLLRDAIEVSG